jgi:hypothetical protein
MPEPGGVLARAFANERDAAEVGRSLAAQLAGRSAGQRGVLIVDLGGGASPESRHWWHPRSDAEATAILRDGVDADALRETVRFMETMWGAYVAAGGVELDFLCSNVEVRPDRWNPHWPPGFEWPRVKRAAGHDAKDDRLATEDLSRWSWEQQGRCVRESVVEPYRRRFPDSRAPIANLASANWRAPHKDSNGWSFHDGAPAGVSAPLLYLTETAQGQDQTIANVLGHVTSAYQRVAPPVAPVLADVGFAGNNKPRRGREWRAAWEALTRLVLSDRHDDVVVWWNRPPYGEPMSTEEEGFMGRVIAEGIGA